MMRSLRSRLILASVLWTGGLLMLMHMFSILVLHVFPGGRTSKPGVPMMVAVVLMAAGVVGVRRGLDPFRALRERLAAVRCGDTPRVEGEYPSEVQPLIDELNALLEDREKTVKRALATAGDLAHGLKTPLALLVQDADRAESSGYPELAASITSQVERMSRQVNYHLARARAAAAGPAGAVPSGMADRVSALVRTMAKLHGDRGLNIASTVASDVHVRVQREDLDEMLGNLLDNACKWARSRVVVAASRKDGSVLITVDDDGPGLAPDERARVLERGVRLDEAAPGSGLGLAIVRELVQLYGGSVTLEDSPLGGLQARATLPSA
jgi:signal transduction histidine kinase